MTRSGEAHAAKPWRDAPTASVAVELTDGSDGLVPLGPFRWDTGSSLRNLRLRRLD